MAKPAHILIIHVSIDDVAPPVWRRIQVDGDITLRNLHHILQASFGWTSSHLHQFDIEDDTYAMLDNEYVPDLIEEPGHGPRDDRKAKLGRLVYPGQRFIYLYDFGDSWAHTVHIESISEAPEKLGYATVIDGAGACPPEDVGGPPGYIEFLDTIERRPRSQEAREMLDWAGGEFDAKVFDKRAANATLLRMAVNGWGKK
ncbi:plasmid pRiA4b ORF-3 family protein [Massilia niastensis]|uniref:plasmid pRiA4b ORF-3 family protein n=1 Tax=Massilia niastensis TaxID=544911 RepID=UPI0003A9C525|nr:plasmid pRiA4b ORF-3 family protein [Massilia niastensis]